MAICLAPIAQRERRLDQHVEVGPQIRHLLGGQPAGPAHASREPQLRGARFEPLPFRTVAHDRQPPFHVAPQRERLQQSIESLLRDQPSDESDREALVRHVLRLMRRQGAELRHDGDGEIGGVAAHQCAGEIAAGHEPREPAQHAALFPVRPPALVQIDVLMREQHGGDAEAAGGGEHLLGHGGVGLFFYLNEIGAAVAQQRLERAAPVGLVRGAGGEGKDLEAALAFPGDVDRLAEPGVAPALRHGDSDFETTRRQRAQLAAMTRLQIRVGQDEGSAQNGRHRTRTCDLRYVRPAL